MWTSDSPGSRKTALVAHSHRAPRWPKAVSLAGTRRAALPRYWNRTLESGEVTRFKKIERDVQRVFADLTHEMGLKVVLSSLRGQRQQLRLGVGPGSDIVGQWRAELPQRPDDPLPLFDRAVVTEQNAARLAPALG